MRLFWKANSVVPPSDRVVCLLNKIITITEAEETCLRLINDIRNAIYSYWAPTFLKDDKRYVQYEIGEYTYGKPNVLAHDEDTRLKIGKFCSIAMDVTILLGGEHYTNRITTYPLGGFFDQVGGEENYARSKGDVIIGNDVWIGHGAMILSGVSIGHGAVIAANATITKDVPPYAIVGGNPARLIRYRFSEDAICSLLAIAWWDWPIRKIRANISELLSDDIVRFLATYSCDE